MAIELVTISGNVQLTHERVGKVFSVNEKTGEVILTAEDVGALPQETYIPSIEGLASEEYVNQEISSIDLSPYAKKEEIPSLAGYATEKYVENAIDAIVFPETDLSPYYTKEETNKAITDAKPDLSPYALKSELPSVEGLASEEYVDNAVSDKLDSSALPMAIDTALAQAKDSGEFKGDKGDKGDKGENGLDYILTETDKEEIADTVNSSLSYEEWKFTLEDGTAITKAVCTDEEASNNPNNLICKIGEGISVIDSGLTYSRGLVEIRKIGSILWVIDSGVYNFTSSFTTSKNRTVLQFDLPKALSNKLPNVNGVYGGTGTIGYFPALAYENVTYTTFNCQSYLKRSAIGTDTDTFQLVYTGLSAINGGGLCGFHLKMPLILIEAEV